MRDGRVEPQEAETCPPGRVNTTARLVAAAYAQLQ